MNFFEAQAQAKRHTARLILLFALAVLGLVALSNLLVFAVLMWVQGTPGPAPQSLGAQFDPSVAVLVTSAVLLTVGLGSLYKTLALGGDGRRVAEMLGGRLIAPGSQTPEERRLMNVVEEMAIASGIAVPAVYILDEPGINAFAAGKSPNSAVIGVTRGALEQLDRDELQGVIAHEFSHIFNGDMRLNLRLIGVLHGILLIALLGWQLLRSAGHGRAVRGRGGSSAAAAVPLFGLGLVAVGSIGYFFGQWIKATISRQRELLADASAVQYTRSPEGIAGALKKIGGAQMDSQIRSRARPRTDSMAGSGSLLHAPAAAQYSHAYFAAGVSGWLQSMFATHPPLEARIRRLEPHWDGRFVISVPGGEGGRGVSTAASTTPMAAGSSIGFASGDADALIARVGTSDESALGVARELLAAIPARLRAAAEEPYGARAVIFALLLDSREEIAAEQGRILATAAEPAIALHARALRIEIAALVDRLRLPLAELTVPALQALSADQYRRFRDVVEALMRADQRLAFDEWILRRYVLRRLDEAFGLRSAAQERYVDVATAGAALSRVLSVLARLEHVGDDAAARAAFAAGAAAMTELDLPLEFHTGTVALTALDADFDRLESMDARQKELVLRVCVACIQHDRRLTRRGYELLRTLAGCLDCPLPPLR